MAERLQALVLGSGYAGQGHALALRPAGVEIVGMVGRTAPVVESDLGQSRRRLVLRRLGADRTGQPVRPARPDAITASLPAIEDNTQRNWTQLAREFVADIQGEGMAACPSFRDGWIYQEIVDAVRADQQWTEIAG